MLYLWVPRLMPSLHQPSGVHPGNMKWWLTNLRLTPMSYAHRMDRWCVAIVVICLLPQLSHHLRHRLSCPRRLGPLLLRCHSPFHLSRSLRVLCSLAVHSHFLQKIWGRHLQNLSMARPVRFQMWLPRIHFIACLMQGARSRGLSG